MRRIITETEGTVMAHFFLINIQQLNFNMVRELFRDFCMGYCTFNYLPSGAKPFL